jgi:GxxExxY protein
MWQPLRRDLWLKLLLIVLMLLHRTLRPRILEAVCEHCFCIELQRRGVPYRRQVSVPLIYDGNRLPWSVRLDVLIADAIVCGLKSVESITPVYVAQILTQLKLVDLHMGFLPNFNVALIKEGIRRVRR